MANRLCPGARAVVYSYISSREHNAQWCTAVKSVFRQNELMCVPWSVQTVTNKIRGILFGSEKPGFD